MPGCLYSPLSLSTPRYGSTFPSTSAHTGPESAPPLVVQRGYVEEVYFGRDGAIARAMPPGVPVPPRLRARQELEKDLPPPPWPF